MPACARPCPTLFHFRTAARVTVRIPTLLTFSDSVPAASALAREPEGERARLNVDPPRFMSRPGRQLRSAPYLARATATPPAARLTGPRHVQHGGDRAAAVAGDRPTGTKEALESMLSEQPAATNGAAPRNGNGNGTTSLANVVITPPEGAGAPPRRTSNGNGNGAALRNGNGNGAAAATEMDPCDAGQLETCAVTRVAEEERSRGAASSAQVRTPVSASPEDSVRPARISAAPLRGPRGTPRAAASRAAAVQGPDAGVGGSSSDMGTPYKAAGFSAWRRTIQIYAFAIVFAFKYWKLSKKGTYKGMEGGMSKENISAKKTELARWLKEGLIKLGPTFIKIGQQFSTRVDVLSPEFIKELEELQDNVRPSSHLLFVCPFPSFYDACHLLVRRACSTPAGGLPGSAAWLVVRFLSPLFCRRAPRAPIAPPCTERACPRGLPSAAAAERLVPRASSRGTFKLRPLRCRCPRSAAAPCGPQSSARSASPWRRSLRSLTSSRLRPPPSARCTSPS